MTRFHEPEMGRVPFTVDQRIQERFHGGVVGEGGEGGELRRDFHHVNLARC
eukprot:CAMPEP_0194361828 /NCGR_PEP_ID=MMETSP0174-20130528/9447_1 /TAXON_ID=216777 /ORGANISM="Proboscia alata, Strain PI-D3" /LENGTH=50 /DNA_ID=CAMNT_0039134263 /DNA_START=176 /DNA_END=328 /DNA_ORIENTATION=+